MDPGSEPPPREMKVASRRARREDSLRDAEILQRTISRLRGAALVRRGVYRFRTFEEADEWMIREMARVHARRSWKTSPGSAGG